MPILCERARAEPLFLPQLLQLFIGPDDLVPAVLFRVVEHGVRDLQVHAVGAFRWGKNRDAPYADGDPLCHRGGVGNVEVLNGPADLFKVLK